MGFFVPRELLRERWALTSPFHPCLHFFQRTGGVFFCDTFRQRLLSRTSPAYFTRHAAVWCSDFPPANRKRFTSDHLPSGDTLPQKPKSGSHEAKRTARLAVAPYRSFPDFL